MHRSLLLAFCLEEAKVQPLSRLSRLSRLSQIQVHLTPAASAMPPKFDPSKIKSVYLRCTSGEVGAP